MKIIKVSENIYSGVRPNFKTLRTLKKEGVKDVYDLRTKHFILTYSKILERIYCKILGLNYKQKPLNFAKGFPQLDFFNTFKKNTQDTKTYFHCTCGTHRAGIITQAFKILNGESNVQKATKELIDNGYFNYPKFFKLRVKDFFNPKNAENREKSLKDILEKFQIMFQEK